MQKLQLTIPEPCHENWQNMTPTDQGRFCNACAKEVIDFSTMTDIQVLNYFTNLTHEKVCGRALPEQLDRTISRPEQPKKRLFWYWNYIVMFFMFFGKGNSAKAQGGVKVVTAADLNKIKPTNINDALAGRVGGLIISNNKIIAGKVTDKDGNAIAFASITIKGTKSGTIADAYGAYSLRVNSNAVLIITAASFKDTEVPVGSQTALNNTVMEKDQNHILKEVVVTMALCTRRRPLSEDNKIVNAKPVVIFKVKDDNTDLVIENAVITITRKGDNLPVKILSDNKGIYKFTEIKISDSYFIKVEAEGYEPNEFTIDAKDIKEREKAWEVLLRKQKIENAEKKVLNVNDALAGKVAGLQIKSASVGKIGNQNTIRLGGVVAVDKNKEAICVVDGTVIPKLSDINPDDVDNITILQAPEAVALFGPEGANGAIVITTRKAKEIKMNEVVVSSTVCTKRTTRGGVSYTNIYEGTLLGDTIATVKTLLTNSIKVYPNPVQRNTGFSVALKLKQAGNYNMQVTDASGRILLQQKFSANSKDHTEKIMSDSRWAAGVYYIRVFDSKNQLISKTSFIFD